jgi:hypothetical protein
MLYCYNWFSWWWVRGCSKQVENRNKHIEKRIVCHVGHLQELCEQVADFYILKQLLYTAKKALGKSVQGYLHYSTNFTFRYQRRLCRAQDGCCSSARTSPELKTSLPTLTFRSTANLSLCIRNTTITWHWRRCTELVPRFLCRHVSLETWLHRIIRIYIDTGTTFRD